MYYNQIISTNPFNILKFSSKSKLTLNKKNVIKFENNISKYPIYRSFEMVSTIISKLLLIC